MRCMDEESTVGHGCGRCTKGNRPNDVLMYVSSTSTSGASSSFSSGSFARLAMISYTSTRSRSHAAFTSGAKSGFSRPG